MTISQKFNTVNTVKAQIKTAIENKGVTISPSDTFATYPTKINAIPDASEYIGYLDDVEDVLDDLGITVPAQYSDLDSTISSSYNAIYTELNNISGGTAPSVVLEPVTVTATTTSQTVLPSTGVDGFDEVVVSAVTSDIDNNIQAGNIKKNVTILGVTGSYESGVTPMNTANVPREIDSQGKVGKPTTSFTWTLPNSVTSIETYAFYEALKSCTGLVGLDFSSLTGVREPYAMYSAFSHCSNLASINFSNLVTLDGNQAMDKAFEYCFSLGTASFPELIVIGEETGAIIGGLGAAFNDCTSLTTFSFPKLEAIWSQNGLLAQRCTSLQTMTFPSLQHLGRGGLSSSFYGCTSLTSLSFPALPSTFNVQTSGTTYTNQFQGMLTGVTGCTVHFPSNLQSVIGSWTSVTSGFGGTNTTVLFDLPATT